MDHIDSELTLLREKMARLEEQKLEQKRIQTEKANNPMKTFEDIINNKRKQIESNHYSKSIPLAQFYDREKLAYFEPIFMALQNIMARLDALEQKS